MKHTPNLDYKKIKMSLISFMEEMKEKTGEAGPLYPWDLPKRVIFEKLYEWHKVTREQSEVIIRQLLDEGLLYESREGFLAVS